MTAPVILVLEIALDNVPLEAKKETDNDHLMFVKCHREDSYLLGNKLLDK